MTSSLVLITGATGHLGFKTLLDTLKAGYNVRAAVRSHAKEKVISEHPLVKAINPSAEQLSFIIVPDLAADNAYDEAVKGVDYVIHIASPITTGGNFTQEQYIEYFMVPAERGTIGMLKSASKESKIKRVVITSSVVANTVFGDMFANNGRVYKAEDRIAFDQGPYDNEFRAYSASKALSLNKAEEYIAATKPSYDVVFIHPSFIMGRNDLVRKAEDIYEGTNNYMISVATGKIQTTLPSATVHNDDVARLHVESLNPKIPAGSYIASWHNEANEGIHWEDTNKYVAQLFPEAVKSGVLVNTGAISTIPVKYDISKTEKTFGWKLQGLEKQVNSVVGHYVELSSKA